MATDAESHTGRFNGSGRDNNRPSHSSPENRQSTLTAQQQFEQARARHLRMKLQNAARNRHNTTTHARPGDYTNRAHAKVPLPDTPVGSKARAPLPVSWSRRGLVLLAAIPVAMAGLFFAGFYGGRIVAAYMNVPAVETQVASSEPVAVTGAEITTVAPRPTVPVEVPVEVPTTEADVSKDSGSQGANASASLVERAEAKPLLPGSDAAEPAASQVLPEAVAPPVAETQPAAEAQPADEPQSAAELQPAQEETVAAVEVPTAAPINLALTRATSLVGEGHSLLSKGEVVKARELFTRALALGLPEAALALGRSYDPQYLAQLPSSDAEPDASVAGKMYRQWYEKSVAAGTVSKGTQLDKLLHTMN